MVFESFVVSLLNKYLGKYIKNLDASNLDLGIWNGNAVLTDLTLKDDALGDFDLPVQVKSGYVGKLALTIPWANLYTRPVVVRIEDVFVIAAPITDHDFDVAKGDDYLKATKRRKLEAIERSAKHREITSQSQTAQDYTFFEKLTAQIIKNVQVFVKNIHVRYEDRVTNPTSPFAVGITLKKLTAETTDEFWEPCIVEATVKKVFKYVNLDSLSVYWNCNVGSTQFYGESKNWKVLLRSSIKSISNKDENYEYVLEPFSVEAHVKIDQTSSLDEPKVTIRVVQRDMILGISRTQFHCLMNLIESFELMLANEPYRKYRPNVPLQENAKAWWMYAYTAIVEEKIRTWSWRNIQRHRELYHKYKEFYKKKLLYIDKGVENVTLSSTVLDLEDQLDISSILIARECGLSEFRLSPGSLDESEESSPGWWAWAFGKTEKPTPNNDFDFTSSLSLSSLAPDEKQRLYEALDYSEVTKAASYPKEYVKYVLYLSLENFELQLLNEIRRSVAYVSMTGVSGSLRHRPSSANTSLCLEVDDVSVYGHCVNLGDPQPHILSVSDKDKDMALFNFNFDLNPIHLSADYAISLKLEPVKFVHDTNTVMQIVNFFKMPESIALQELTEVASSGLYELQHRTRLGLEYAVSQQTVIYFDVNLRSPCIVIPEYGSMQRPGTVFVVDFGHLKVKTDLHTKDAVIEDATESELENMLCENYDLNLSKMQILIADKEVNWRNAHAQSTSPYHLLPASEIDITVVRNCSSICSSLPEVKLKGILPLFDIKLSEEKYQQVMQFVSNLPLLTEPLDTNERSSTLGHRPQTLSRHSSRLSLEEVANIQSACREALSHDQDEFEDAEEMLSEHDDSEEWFVAPDLFQDSSLNSSSKASPSTTEKKPQQNTRVSLSGEFTLEKVSVSFDKLTESGDEPYISLVVRDLGTQVTSLEWEMTVRASLGSIHLSDYLFQDVDGGPLTILSSIANQHLISFSYKQIDSKCPDLSVMKDGVQYIINTEFNSMNVQLHREGIVTFQNFVLALVERSEKPNLRRFGERVTSYLEVIPEDGTVEVLDTSRKEKKTYVVDSGKTRMEVTVGEVLVTLSAEDRNFALLSIHGLYVNALLDQRAKYLKSSLKRFDIEDLDQTTLYNKILTVQDDNLCDIEVTYYASDSIIPKNPLSLDLEVSVHFGRLKSVLLHNFITSIQDFFASFASDENRQYATQATSEVVQIQVENMRESDLKIGVEVDIIAPLIKVPVSSQSKHGVIVDLGRLQVKNALKQVFVDDDSCLVDEMVVKFDCFQINRSANASTWTAMHNLVDPTGLDITFARCLDSVSTVIPSWDVEAVLNQLSTTIDESDFRLVTMIMENNLEKAFADGEDGPTHVEKDDISSMTEVEQHQMEVGGHAIESLTDDSNITNRKIRLKAVIDKVILQFLKLSNQERLPYLELSVHKLSGSIVYTGDNCDGTASLGGLFLVDYCNTGPSIERLSVLESSIDKKLISVKYHKEVSDPVGSSQTLEVLSTVMKFHFEEQSVLGIQKILTSLQQSPKRSTSHQLLTSTSLASISSRVLLTKPKTEDDQTTNDRFKLTVNVEQVDITLSRKQSKIIHAAIEDVFTEVITANDKFVIYSRQKGLAVKDLNPLTNYPDVVTIEGSKLFDFEYHSLPDEHPSPSIRTFPHSLLSLDIGKIHMVFLYKLISDIQEFLQALISPETTSYSYELAHKAVQDQLQMIETQGTRIALKVDIEAPIILFPRTSRSTECLIADLGQLHAENAFSTQQNGDTQVVVVDNIDVALQSVQLSRGILDTTSQEMSRRLLMQPVKMALLLSRSMQANAHWLPYLKIDMKLDHIEMNLDEDDYQLLTCGIQQNFAEIEPVFDQNVSETIEFHVVDAAVVADETVTETEENETVDEIWEEMVIDFAFSGLSLTLYNDEEKTKSSSPYLAEHNSSVCLCRCELQESSGTLVRQNDTSIKVNLHLYGCIIEDARPSKMTAFPRMLSHSTEQEHGRRKRRSKSFKRSQRTSMIEVTYEQNARGEMKVELTLQDPTLYISFPLLWSILDFFTASAVEETRATQPVSVPSSPLTAENEVQPNNTAAQPYVFEVKGRLKNPEIVLLGEPEKPNSSALIVQTSIEFEYSIMDDQQTFSTTSKGLVVHSCRYPEREKTLYKVIKPCAIDFQYSYPGQDCVGQEVAIQVPEMKVKISPLFLKTVMAISTSFYGEQQEKDVCTLEEETTVEESEDVWRPKPISKDEWYQKNSLERVPSKICLKTTVTEKCSIEMKCVRVKLYNEVMCHRVPLLLINSTIHSNLWDWSSELKLEADVSMEAWYHNEMLAAWEPLMESEETLSGRRLWQLQLKVCQDNSHLLSFTPDDDNDTFDKEDFDILTTYPVFSNKPRELVIVRHCSLQSSIDQDDYDGASRTSPGVAPGRPASIEIDEVDFGIADDAPQSPVVSDITRDIPQATYVVLSSFDIIELTVTRAAVDVLADVVQVFTDISSNTAADSVTLPESPLLIMNELGIHAAVSVSDRREFKQETTPSLTITMRKSIDIDDVIDGDQSPSHSNTRHLNDAPRGRGGGLEPRAHFYVQDDSALPDDEFEYFPEDDEDVDEVDCGTGDGQPGGKRFLRSQSMPASNMLGIIKITEERLSRNLEDIEDVLKMGQDTEGENRIEQNTEGEKRITLENVEVKTGHAQGTDKDQRSSGNVEGEPGYSVGKERIGGTVRNTVGTSCAEKGIMMDNKSKDFEDAIRDANNEQRIDRTLEDIVGTNEEKHGDAFRNMRDDFGGIVDQETTRWTPKDITGTKEKTAYEDEKEGILLDTRAREEHHAALVGQHGIKKGSSRKIKRSVVLGSVEEEEVDGMEEGEQDEVDLFKRKSTTEEVESEQAGPPSFISGAFATMGLMAGVGGRPIPAGSPLIEDPAAATLEKPQFERPQYKKGDDYISLQIDGFDELSFVLIAHAGQFLYKLLPKQHGRFYYIVVEVAIKHGQKRVTIRAPLQVKNNLNIPVDLLESGALRAKTSTGAPVSRHRMIGTVQPKGKVNVPLFSAHKGNLFVQPALPGFKKSRNSVSWKDFSEDNRSTILSCLPEENGPNYTCSVKVVCELDSLNRCPSKVAPHHILQLYPTITFWNFLPCGIHLELKENEVAEFSIDPGTNCHVTSVTTNKTSTFLVQVPEYLGASWCGSFKVGGDCQPDDEIEMTPEHPVPNKLFIKLEYVERGCLIVNLFSPYWIVNKTNLSITYKASKLLGDIYSQSASNTKPLLFNSSFRTKTIMLKLNGCEWSKSFSLDAVGDTGQLECKEIKTSKVYEMSISIDLCHNRLTKIISILPKYVIINKTERELSIFEMEQKHNYWIFIKANQCVPFWPQTKSNAFLLRLANNPLTSKVMKIDSLFPTIFRVGANTLLEMNCEISESSTTIVFKSASSVSLPMMENLCEDIAIQLEQKACGNTVLLSPFTSIIYCWDEPSAELVLLWKPQNSDIGPEQLPLDKDGFGKVEVNVCGKKLRKANTKRSSLFSCGGCISRRRRSASLLSLTTESNAAPFDVADNMVGRNKTIYWVSYLDGCRRSVLFTDDPWCAKQARRNCEGEAVSLELFLSLDGVRLSVLNNEPTEVVYLGISSATSIWEVEKSPGKWKRLNVETSSILEEAWRNDIQKQRLTRDIEVDFDSMTMKKPYRGTLNRTYEPGLWIQYCSAVNYESFSAKIHRVQIDNQIFGTLFPCALYPSPLPASISQRYGFKPFFEISTIYRNNKRHNIMHVRYFKVLIQEMNVKLEKEFLVEIYKLLYGDCGEQHDEAKQFQKHLRSIALSLEDTLMESGSLETQWLFLEYFHLSPLKINMSISLRTNLYQSEKNQESALFEFLVNSVGSPLTEVNDVLIKLACFERCGLFVTQGSLVSRARTHYTWQAVRQFHAIVLGLDVLGNPYGFFTDIGEGVKDLFYEPYQGIVLGPQEFASGVVRGVKSLLGHAIGGTAGAMSRIAGTFGEAFVTLSFDKDYTMKRRLRMRNGPSGIQEGVAMGGKSFLMGLYFGVSGVVTKPIQGAKSKGVEGFFKGFGKGILGLVTRPTVGVFDMVSTTLDGIRRSAEQEGEDIVVRMRMPRFSPPEAPLLPYVEYQANGNGILKSLPRSGDVFNDVYVDHIPVPRESGSSVALFTNTRVMTVYQDMFWSEWNINLNIPFDDIDENARLIDGAIVIKTKDDHTEKIESSDQSTLQIVLHKLGQHLRQYRASKTHKEDQW